MGETPKAVSSAELHPAPPHPSPGRQGTSAGQDLVWGWLREDEAGHGQLAA